MGSDVISRRRLLYCGFAGGLACLSVRPSVAAALGPVPGHLHLACAETGESFNDAYRAEGVYLQDAVRRLNWLLRDFHCDRAVAMDPALLDLLAALQHRLQPRGPIIVTSAYRTLATNAELREEGLPAAEHSMHVVGRAADIRVDGCRLGELHHAAMALRRGGVGFYPAAGFVHIDTGPLRFWQETGHHRHRRTALSLARHRRPHPTAHRRTL